MQFLVKLLHLFPPEKAHQLTLTALKRGFFPKASDNKTDPILAQRLLGLDFPHPIGLAAGFDKNAEVIVPLLKLGFAFVEAGTVTPLLQPGNPEPRLFRIPEARAVINRLGFNNEGLEAFCARIAETANDPLVRRRVVGANVGCNKESKDKTADFVKGVVAVSELADYVTINVSSPNTPGLRGLQNRAEFEQLLSEVQKKRSHLSAQPSLLVKISPDLDEAGLQDVADVAMKAKVDGLIISNTTISRPASLPKDIAAEAGGLSGAPLFDISNQALARVYALTKGKLPLIGVGGVGSAEDAYKKIRSGASLVQLYTALIYEGPGLIGKIKSGLVKLLQRDGFRNVSEAVGVDVKNGTRDSGLGTR